MGPMSVDRVVSAQAGSSGSERRDRACLPISMDDDWEEIGDSHGMLWVGGGGGGVVWEVTLNACMAGVWNSEPCFAHCHREHSSGMGRGACLEYNAGHFA